MKKLLIAAMLCAGVAHAATTYKPEPYPLPQGEPCWLELDAKTTINARLVIAIESEQDWSTKEYFVRVRVPGTYYHLQRSPSLPATDMAYKQIADKIKNCKN